MVQAVSLANTLRDAGIWVSPIGPPTVPAGQCRLRLSLNIFYTVDQLRWVATTIKRSLHHGHE